MSTYTKKSIIICENLLKLEKNVYSIFAILSKCTHNSIDFISHHLHALLKYGIYLKNVRYIIFSFYSHVFLLTSSQLYH